MALFSKSNQNLLNLLTIHAGESPYDTYAQNFVNEMPKKKDKFIKIT